MQEGEAASGLCHNGDGCLLPCLEWSTVGCSHALLALGLRVLKCFIKKGKVGEGGGRGEREETLGAHQEGRGGLQPRLGREPWGDVAPCIGTRWDCPSSDAQGLLPVIPLTPKPSKGVVALGEGGRKGGKHPHEAVTRTLRGGAGPEGLTHGEVPREHLSVI